MGNIHLLSSKLDPKCLGCKQVKPPVKYLTMENYKYATPKHFYLCKDCKK